MLGGHVGATMKCSSHVLDPLVSGAMLLACLLLSVRPAAAQMPAERFATEWGITSGGAMDMPAGATGGQFWAVQLRWGKVLTAPYGPGPLRGTFEYAFEVVPAMVLQQAGFRLTAGQQYVSPHPLGALRP